MIFGFSDNVRLQAQKYLKENQRCVLSTGLQMMCAIKYNGKTKHYGGNLLVQ